jgi:hypothetical protein
VAALAEMDADVIALVELENTPGVARAGDLAGAVLGFGPGFARVGIGAALTASRHPSPGRRRKDPVR